MGRWKQAKQCIIDVGLVGRGANPATTELIVTAHNADCDAYEARIAELEQERDAMWSRVDPQRDEIDVPSLCAQLDAAELRIAELEALLRRVKAESLRVVECGEAIELFDLPVESAAFTHDGDLYIYEGMTTDWLAFNVSKLRWMQLECDTIVQPVRLERWEK